MGASSNPPRSSTITLKILVVEDDETIRATTSYILTDAGHSVSVAADGIEALGLVRTCVFDVAICDVRLPKLDGMTLFRLLRRESPSTAVIVVTSYPDVQDALECLEAGGADFITKPLDRAGLLRRIDRIGVRVARWPARSTFTNAIGLRRT
jgi:DNA-binding response OmpR family regulator